MLSSIAPQLAYKLCMRRNKPCGIPAAAKALNKYAWLNDGNAACMSYELAQASNGGSDIDMARAAASDNTTFARKFLPGMNPRCETWATAGSACASIRLATPETTLLSEFSKISVWSGTGAL